MSNAAYSDGSLGSSEPGGAQAEAWVSARVTAAFLAGLANAARGRAAPDVLRRAADSAMARLGVTGDSLRDPDNRLSHALALELLDEAVRITGDADLALHVAERVAPESLGLVGYLGRHCDTVRDAFDTVFRYHGLLHAGAEVRREERGDETWLCFGLASGLPESRQATEFVMALALFAVRDTAGIVGGLRRVLFVHPRPARVAEHERIFAAPVTFAAPENALVFPSDLFTAPLRDAEPGLRSILEQHAEIILSTPGRRPVAGHPPIVEAVRRIVREQVRGPQPALDDVAHALGLSPRTLRRRLAEADTRYKRELDHVLAARALDLLAAGAGSESIAYALGFSDASAFRRAFKRWTGHSPARHPARIGRVEGPDPD